MKKSKPEFLKRTDHRLDMSPTGRNLFISRDKQAQNRVARRIRVWMRVVIVLVTLGIAAAVGMVAAFYLVPWFRAELTAGVTPEESDAGASSFVMAEQEYDKMGLPVYSDDICLLVVNAQNPAERDFAPELTGVSGVSVNSHIAEALRLMVSAAKNDGLSLAFTEGYISYGEQEKRFDRKVQELIEEENLTTVMARTEAKTQEPAPGESDFQSGMCIRLDGDPDTFETSKTYSWLKVNMGKYGFVFRYPEYKEDSTGHTADPTVIRYVGGTHALAMQQRSMCLEEYLDYLASQ